MEALNWLNSVLGVGADPNELTFTQIALRGVITFLVALLMVRLGDKRFLSKKTAFDVILGFVLASMLARAINGSASFWPTLAGGFVLVALHRLMAIAARHSHAFGQLVKGRSDLVIEDGRVLERAMRVNHLSQRDLEEDLRLKGVRDVAEVEFGYVERNGEVSVVRK